MKKTDIALLLLIVGISLAAAYFVGKYVMDATGGGVAEVEKVESISADITPPSSSIFNKDAINPTVSISVSGSNNTQPIGQ